MSVSANHSVNKVKSVLCETAKKQKDALLLSHMAYDLFVYREKDNLLDPNKKIGVIPYILNCRQHSTIPKLVLVQKAHDPFTPSVGNFFISKFSKKKKDINRYFLLFQIL